MKLLSKTKRIQMNGKKKLAVGNFKKPATKCKSLKMGKLNSNIDLNETSKKSTKNKAHKKKNMT